MAKDPEEWLKQAEYDMETAEAIFGTGKYIYAVFMSHLAIEKALKALYMKKLDHEPPKIHDLIFILKKITPNPPDPLRDFIHKLNSVSVPTRYPDDLERITAEFDKKKTGNILKQSREALEWLKKQY